jgi:MscS family membrane protein
MCYFFTKTTNWDEFMAIQEKINFEIMKIVENNNSSFAFPSRSIYLENSKDMI